MSVLNVTKATLQELCSDKTVPMEGVWYGACQQKELEKWNYFVFERDRTTKSTNRCDFQTFYNVHVIHEDYIPEGYIETVVNALETQTGAKLKVTGNDITYGYTFKGNTDMVVEIATISLFHPEKRC